MNSATPELADKPGVGLKAGGYFRWVICGLLFLATTINYVDRQVIGVLKPRLTEEFHWTQIDYSNIVFSFQAAYALGFLGMGWFLDKVGVKKGFLIAVLLWSLAAMAHGLVEYIPMDGTWAKWPILTAVGGVSVAAFCLARFALGIAEAGNFPAAIKTVAEWFPRKERALATGIFNSGSNVGALITPVVVPWLAIHWGWPWAFYVTGGLGLFWLVLWLLIFQEPEAHPRLSAQELAYIRSDVEVPAPKIPWLQLLRHRQVWAFAAAKFMTDPIWWFYLFWIPDFLDKQYHVNLKDFGPPLVVIYLMTDVGSIGGGWMSSALLKRGWSVNASRKTTMLICALCVVPVIAAAWVSNVWVAVVLVGLAASAHQGWSANLYTLVSDTAPRRAVSSVVGFGSMAGAVGGMIIAKSVGYILEWTHNSYLIPFAIAASAYLLALLVIHVLLPNMEPMRTEGGPESAAAG